MPDDDLRDRLAVAETVARCMCNVDRRRWRDLASLLAAVVHVDYSSLRTNEPAGERDAAALIEAWRLRHEPIPAYQHHLGTIVAEVDGDDALCRASGIAVHRRRAPEGGFVLWQLGVAYDWCLRRIHGIWRINAIKATKLWERTEHQPD